MNTISGCRPGPGAGFLSKRGGRRQEAWDLIIEFHDNHHDSCFLFAPYRHNIVSLIMSDKKTQLPWKASLKMNHSR